MNKTQIKTLGVPKETKTSEGRVAITPDGVREFERAGVEVFVGLLSADAHYGPFDTHLTAKWFAVPEDGRSGVLREVVALMRAVVREPDKTVFIGGTQQHHPTRDATLEIGRGDGDRFWFADLT